MVAALAHAATVLAAEPIHVLVWDKRQPRQSDAYDNFLGNEIVSQLKAISDDLEFRSVALDDADQGLSSGNFEIIAHGAALTFETIAVAPIFPPFRIGSFSITARWCSFVAPSLT